MVKTKWCVGDKDDNIVDVYTIRSKVFIHEQKISPEVEYDNKDGEAFHILIYDTDKPVATGRLIIENNQYIIGRISVLKEERKNGYGGLVVKMLVRKAFNLGADKVIVHAQVSAVEFYKKVGFVAVSDEYIEQQTSIKHIDMVKNEDIKGCCE